ncbi:MAG: UDP-N-acetylmuramoyl-L-alanyl-D-glutamate--2,6-diaminopimelate ligase [Elusimicrobiota bacterium]
MNSLKYLVEGIPEVVRIEGTADIAISGIAYDSRKVSAGNIFVCLHGQRTDGEKFVGDAVSRGAVAVVVEVAVATEGSAPADKPVTYVIVNNALSFLARVSAKFYSFPSEKLNIVGVTGTNGKTTVTYLIESVLREAGIPCGVIGTLNYRVGRDVIRAENTTPQSADLQKLLWQAVKNKIKTVVMEVSSHGLELGRVLWTEFDSAVFTNLTRDHLDFHKTFEDYFRAKLKLFEMLAGDAEPCGKKTNKFAIINVDDRWGRVIAENMAGKIRVVTYGINQKNSPVKPDVRADRAVFNREGTTMKIGDTVINSPLIGRYNAYNILACYAYADAYGIDKAVIKKGIEKLCCIPGRLHRVECGQPFTVLVDYAHTDDALTNVLNTIREIKPAHIITVFGCGGDRDRTKRPIMGEVSSMLSDYVIVTSDNPRAEDPQKILLDIEVGIRRTGRRNYEIMQDREKAIERAINMASEGDVVLLAGKGHEDYQIMGDKKIHFNDTEVAERYLEKWKR